LHRFLGSRPWRRQRGHALFQESKVSNIGDRWEACARESEQAGLKYLEARAGVRSKYHLTLKKGVFTTNVLRKDPQFAITFK
jgi:hypothetical protein